MSERDRIDRAVAAASRVLSDRMALACGIDAEDQWKLHGSDFIQDAAAAIAAYNLTMLAAPEAPQPQQPDFVESTWPERGDGGTEAW